MGNGPAGRTGHRAHGDSRQVAAAIAAKDRGVVRAAKQSLNGIDPIDFSRSYRFEQGFTYELNLRGAGDAARAAFLRGERAGQPAADESDG